MKKIYPQKVGAIGVFCFLFLLCFNVFAQVGINTTEPTTMLDVNGAISFREGPTLSLTNGVNNIISLGTTPFSQYRITGPNAAFSIRNILPLASSDGQMLTLINTTSYPLTILHEGSGTAARKIRCPGETNLVLNGKYATVTLQYNKSLTRWIVVDYTDIRYGDNIKSVKGTTNILTNSNLFKDMDDMTLTFIPKHSTVYVSFGASGDMEVRNGMPEQCFANFRLVNVSAGNRIEAGITTLVTDYDYDDTVGEGVATSWSVSLGMFPVTVTPGVSTTLKIQWLRDGNVSSTLYCYVNSDPNQSHRSMTVFD